MSGVPRSQRLIGWNSNGAGSSPLFQCPDNFTTLVKSAIIYNSGATAALASLIAQYTLENFGVYLFHVTIEPNSTYFWSQWVVLHPDDYIFLNVGGEVMTCSVFGAVLAGPPQFPPATRLLPTQEPHG